MTRSIASIVFLTCVMASVLQAEPAKLAVRVDQPGITVSPTLYGIFFEEINRAGDGGLYGEMIQNRSFEDAPVPMGWTVGKAADGDGSLALDKSVPLNPANPTSLRVDVKKAPFAVVNQGFKGTRRGHNETPDKFMPRFEKAVADATTGLSVRQGKDYLLSLYARAAEGFAGPLTLTLQSKDGKALAQQKVEGLGKDWKKFDVVLTSSGTDPDARLVIATAAPGTFWLDMVSLFPRETFKNRPNGMRADLAQMIADMKPAFVRFPGGCYVEGDTLANAFRWKKTVGDIAQRPGHWNLWGYQCTYGLGYHEYLQFCEDLGAEPLFVINCGTSHVEQRADDRGETPSVPDLDEYLQDALDAIEYANGPADSKWGSVRAKAGHPAPFNLKFMEIGNENGGKLHDQRYALFHDAIKAKYPNVRLVANHWRGRFPNSRKVEIVDEHYYNNPEFFMNRSDMYDKYDRKAHQVYVGEYAVTRECGAGNLIAALGEAAYMTGLERNGDVVVMASYAPLLVSPPWKGWNPNAIVFDAAHVYGTPSYHVQAMFGNHRADVVLPVTIETPKAPARGRAGMIGVGTWNTQAEFKDILVTAPDGKVLLKSDFSKDRKGWNTSEGNWEVKDGALRQTGNFNGARALAGDKAWTDYTLTLKARKLGGAEGFLILFQNQSPREKNWWNIGGWGNKRHAIESAGLSSDGVDGKIETGRWYDIKVECAGPAIKCYLDGKLVHSETRQGYRALYAVAGLSADKSEVILKVVNVGPDATETALTLQGAGKLQPTAKALVMAGQSTEDENSFAEPTRIAPKETTINNVAPEFKHTFPAYSVTIIRAKRQ